MTDELKEQIVTDIPVEKSSSTALLLPEDAYECVITHLEEFKKRNSLSKKEEQGAMLTFEIFDGPYKGQIFKQFFNNKLSKRSKLTVLCRAVWGDEFEPEEMAQINMMNDFKRFLLNKPLKVILLIRRSYTDTFWYDVAFFLKSNFYDEAINKVIIPKK